MTGPVCIVGAGIAGLTCARLLADHGFDVTLLDKGRAPGGRTSRRRAEPFHFDHGAQYFTAREPGFVSQVEAWREQGVVDVWHGNTVSIGPKGVEEVVIPDQRFVGTPGMNAIARHLADGLDVEIGVEVSALQRDGERWCVSAKNDEAERLFDQIVLALPSVQAQALLQPISELTQQLDGVGMSPCWAVLLGFDQRLELPFDAGWASDNPIAWLARNNSKPGRDGAESWVLHASRNWSERMLEETSETVLSEFDTAFRRLTGLSAEPSYRSAHRWRYALAHEPLGKPCLFDAEQRLGLCGDWCLAGRVEAAFLSGTAMAKQILATGG